MTQSITRMAIGPLFTIGAQMTRLGRYLGHDYVPMTGGHFEDASPAATSIGWTAKPQDQLAFFAQSRQLVTRIAQELYRECVAIGGNGKTYFQVMDGGTTAHAFVSLNPTYPIPPNVRPWITDPNNHNAFRAMIAGFTPYGRELPGPRPRHSLRELVAPDPASATFEQRSAEHARQRWQANAPMSGHVALGRSGQIVFSHYHVVPAEELLIRYALANTTDDHIFDGRVLQLQIINVQTGRMTFCALGGGRHHIVSVDGANSATGGVAFNVMLRTYTALLGGVVDPQELATQGWTDPARLAQLAPDVASARQILGALDWLGTFGTYLRYEVGADVVGAPTPDLYI